MQSPVYAQQPDVHCKALPLAGFIDFPGCSYTTHVCTTAHMFVMDWQVGIVRSSCMLSCYDSCCGC